MRGRTAVAGLPGLAVAALLAAGCRDAVSPAHHSLRAPQFAAAAGTGVSLDQMSGSFSLSGMHIGKGFVPTNPHLGDAIVATFFWLGSTNTITTVTDHLCDDVPQPSGWPGTPVGNTYTLVDYVTTGGISMATYVATNVQNFPDPNPDASTELCVHAIFAQPVTDAGILISAWSGVNVVSGQALGAHSSASGSGSTTTVADAGAIPVGTGALTYGVTMSNGLFGRDPPQGFGNISTQSDASIVGEGDYAVQSSAGTVDPRWTWYFSSPSSWLATAFTLNPPLHLGFTVQPSTTLPLLPIQPAVQVTVLDAFGNRNTSYTGQVTIAIGHNGGLVAPGTLSGTKTVTVVNGVATFSDLSIDQPGTGYTLVVSGPTLTGAESTPFNIGAF